MDDDDAFELDARRKATLLRHQKPPPFRNRNARQGIRSDPLPRHHHRAARIDIGWEVSSRTRAVGDIYHPAGGVVVDIATTETADPDTGEICDVVRFRTYDLFIAQHLALTWVDLVDVDFERITPPDRAAGWAVIIRLAKQIGAARHRWPTPQDLDRLAMAARLARAIT